MDIFMKTCYNLNRKGRFNMRIVCTIAQFPRGKTEIINKEYQYWLILSGNGQISSEISTFFLSGHDVLELPSNRTFQFLCTEAMQIGIISLFDFKSPNTYLQKKNYNDTEMIRKVFFLALDFQGFHHENISKMMYHIHHLLYETLSNTGLKDYRINPQIALALNEMNKHYLEPDYDFNAVIAASSYSASHFHKLFHEAVGYSPIGWIHKRRIEHAQYLLRQPKRPSIKETAMECGYSDAYYFSKMFRKIVGMSPSEYVLQTEERPL